MGMYSKKFLLTAFGRSSNVVKENHINILKHLEYGYS
jgi:hypothetical protein